MLVRITQLLIVSVPIALFAWLLNQELVPTGTFAVRHDVADESPFIDRLLPDARVDLAGNITNDPAFFFVHPHRAFDSVDAEIWFQNDKAPIVELGALGNVEAQAYDLHPLQNLIIDNLGWIRLEKDGKVLLQRTLTYRSIDEFLANPPAISTVATYHASIGKPFVLDGYVPAGETQSVAVSLRGSHEFKTYVKNETLSYDFRFMDMNRDEGADPITLVVTNADGVSVGDARAADDGDVAASSKGSAMRHIALRIPGLPEGAYKVQMQAGRDIFWRTISTTQQNMVFLNALFLGDEVGYNDDPRPVLMWTEAKHLSFATRHVEGLQTVGTVHSSSRLAIDEPYKRFELGVTEPGVVAISSDGVDLEMTADGHVAFDPSMFFNPDPVRLTDQTDLDALGVDYVYAEYVSPRSVGDWYVANATFDARKIVLDKGTWKFVFSVPGIRAAGGTVSVKSINLTMTRPPFSLNDLYGYVAGTNR